MQSHRTFVTVPLSGTVSDLFALGNAQERAGVFCPVVDSCAINLLGSWDQTSGNAGRIQGSTPQNSGDLTLFTGPGSKWLSFPVEAMGAPFVQLQFGVAQSAVRSLCIVTKL